MSDNPSSTHTAEAASENTPAGATSQPTPVVSIESFTTEFCGIEHTISGEQTLTFGRLADLEIDDNPFLHRHLGTLFIAQGITWLENVGAQIPITIADTKSPSQLIVYPGSRVAVPFATAALRFSAGQIPYEITLTQVGVENRAGSVPERGAGTPTVHIADTTLNEEQRLLLVGLGLPLLKDPHKRDLPLPSNQEVADKLGWTLSKFNRKLDYLCDKFARAGVRGMRGAQGELASHRRVALVRHAIDSGLVTIDDIPGDW